MNRGHVLLAVLIAALGTGGFLLTIEGKDPVALAAKQKNSILTAEQISVSFQGVGGKLTDIHVTEEERVKRGDLIASLDTTDVELTISRTELDIENTKLRMKQREDAIRIAEEKLANALSQAEIAVAQARTSKQQIMEGARKEDIQRQKLSVEAAETALQLQQKTSTSC